MIRNGSALLRAAPLDPMVPTKERPASFAWHRNDYTDLRDTLIGPADDAQDGAGLFPSGWTPEAEGKA